MKITIEFESLEEMLNFQKNGFNATQTEQKAVCDISLTDLLPAHEDGCNRARNCLGAQSIETVDDLLKWTDRDLLRTPNLGRQSLNLIKVKLAERGLSLKAANIPIKGSASALPS